MGEAAAPDHTVDRLRADDAPGTSTGDAVDLASACAQEFFRRCGMAT